MLYTDTLDDSIKSLTLILIADHSTLLFLPSFFFSHKIKNILFHLWVNLYMITDIYLHDPPPFNGPFFMTPSFSESQKVVNKTEGRPRVGQVNVRIEFWDCYFGQGKHWLAKNWTARGLQRSQIQMRDVFRLQLPSRFLKWRIAVVNHLQKVSANSGWKENRTWPFGSLQLERFREQRDVWRGSPVFRVEMFQKRN